MSFIQRLKFGLSRTKDAIVSKVVQVVRRSVAVNDEFWEQIEETLILADVGMNTSAAIVDRMRERYRTQKPKSMEEIIPLLCDVMAEQLLPDPNAAPPHEFPLDLNVVLITGVNGSGKTTSIG